MTTSPSPEDVAATARTVGIALAPETAARVAHAVTPAVQTFAPIAASLPFDLDPGAFLAAQRAPEDEK
ncbi:hypothetical protein [Azorhizobium doebereinerae]|uniref:hypothetical protein n=1 Tax=Azorhizobium doebereinerae TaxID=281091 RepID=UPI000417F66E|nr:hypothetical protein [Azorhizobium doebereinerae]